MTLINHLEIKRQAIRESIEHWKRMIGWVYLEPQDEPVNFEKMKRVLWEAPEGEYCALCKMYNDCESCPLNQIGERCLPLGSAYRRTNSLRHKAYKWIYGAKNYMLPALYACYELCL